MTELPRHPDGDDRNRARAGGRSRGAAWGTYALMAIVVIAVLGMVVLHLAGVIGPGAHQR